jgi:hypothetical protein
MPFIRAIKVDEPGTSSEHVVEVLVSDFTTSRPRRQSVEEVHLAIRRGARYRAFDERTHQQTDVEARIAFGGRKHVITVRSGVETPDLLKLPRY